MPHETSSRSRQGGGHPRMAGFVLITAVTVLIIVLALASTFGFH